MEPQRGKRHFITRDRKKSERAYAQVRVKLEGKKAAVANHREEKATSSKTLYRHVSLVCSAALLERKEAFYFFATHTFFIAISWRTGTKEPRNCEGV